MTEHTAFRRLSAAAIDTTLASGDRRSLDAHLAVCPACRAYATALRRDAADLRAIAVAHAPDRVRRAVLVAAAGSRAQRPRSSWSLAFAAALLVALLLVALSVVGSMLRDRTERNGPILWAPVSAPALLTDPVGSVELHHLASARTASGERVIATSVRGSRVDVLVSGDGATWEPAATAPFGEGVVTGIDVVEVAGSPLLVAFGSLDGAPAVWTSTDGTSWATEPVAAASGDLRSVMAHGDRLLAVGGGADPAFWWRALGGGPWTAARYAGDRSLPDPLPDAVVAVRGELVALASGSTYRSTDGSEWTESTNDLPGSGLTGVAFHNGRLVAVGSIPPRIGSWSSSDGIEWIDMPTNGPAMGSRSALLLHGSVLVSVGSGPSGARAWTSTDGRAWLEGMNLPDGNGGRAHDVASIGDDIVAVGAAGSAGAIWWGSEVTR